MSHPATTDPTAVTRKMDAWLPGSPLEEERRHRTDDEHGHARVQLDEQVAAGDDAAGGDEDALGGHGVVAPEEAVRGHEDHDDDRVDHPQGVAQRHEEERGRGGDR